MEILYIRLPLVDSVLFFKKKKGKKRKFLDEKRKKPHIVEWQRIASAARFNMSTADDNEGGGRITEKTC